MSLDSYEIMGGKNRDYQPYLKASLYYYNTYIYIHIYIYIIIITAYYIYNYVALYLQFDSHCTPRIRKAHPSPDFGIVLGCSVTSKWLYFSRSHIQVTKQILYVYIYIIYIIYIYNIYIYIIDPIWSHHVSLPTKTKLTSVASLFSPFKQRHPQSFTCNITKMKSWMEEIPFNKKPFVSLVSTWKNFGDFCFRFPRWSNETYRVSYRTFHSQQVLHSMSDKCQAQLPQKSGWEEFTPWKSPVLLGSLFMS